MKMLAIFGCNLILDYLNKYIFFYVCLFPLIIFFTFKAVFFCDMHFFNLKSSIKSDFQINFFLKIHEKRNENDRDGNMTKKEKLRNWKLVKQERLRNRNNIS